MGTGHLNKIQNWTSIYKLLKLIGFIKNSEKM